MADLEYRVQKSPKGEDISRMSHSLILILCNTDDLMTYLWMCIDHSSEQSIPQTVVTSNGQDLSLEGWIFALE